MTSTTKLEKILLSLIASVLVILAIALVNGRKSKTAGESKITHVAKRIDTNTREYSSDKKTSSLRKTPAKRAETSNQTGNAETALLIKTECLEACQNRIITLLAVGDKIKTADANLIIQNATEFAVRLASAPESLASLLATQQEDEGEDSRDQFAAHAVWEALTEEQRLEAGASLLQHDNPSFRVVGVKLAQQGVTHDRQSTRAFDLLIRNEKTPEVLISALNALSQQADSGIYNPETIAGLDQIINLHDSDYMRGTALIAKANIVSATEDTKADIHRGLLSSSVQIQESALQAYIVTRDRQNRQLDNSLSPWTDNQDTYDLINAIIDNPKTSNDMRKLALTIFND